MKNCALWSRSFFFFAGLLLSLVIFKPAYFFTPLWYVPSCLCIPNANRMGAWASPQWNSRCGKDDYFVRGRCSYHHHCSDGERRSNVYRFLHCVKDVWDQSIDSTRSLRVLLFSDKVPFIHSFYSMADFNPLCRLFSLFCSFVSYTSYVCFCTVCLDKRRLQSLKAAY